MGEEQDEFNVMDDSIDNCSNDSPSANGQNNISVNLAAQGVSQAKFNDYFRTNDSTAMMSMTIE